MGQTGGTHRVVQLVGGVELAVHIHKLHGVHLGLDDLARWRRAGHLHVAGRSAQHHMLFDPAVAVPIVVRLLQEEGRLGVDDGGATTTKGSHR